MSELTLKELAKKPDQICSGARLCAGCDETIIVRMVLKATRGPTIVTTATGCLEVATSTFPYTAWDLPWIHSAFENTAATASGIEAAIKAMKNRKKSPLSNYEKIDVMAFAGDGGTYDIGFQALSGAIERGHDFTYILLDNEAYMNTGIQRSGATPFTASTTTSPAGKVIQGKTETKKPIDDIIIAHEIPYFATLNAAWPLDVIKKTRKGIEVDGPAFLHAIVPCSRGWRYPPEKTIEISRLATQTCVFPLYEVTYNEGKPSYELSAPSLSIAKRPEIKKPVEDYLKPQGRFNHLFRPEKKDALVKQIQEHLDLKWEILLNKCGF
jgi:pyruvate ferredoxin oxidoreductase beta subunit